MKVSVEKKENNMVELTVEMPVEAVAKAYDRAYRKLAEKVNIPGFRKGKTPRKILEARLGLDAFQAEAFEFIVPDAYRKAVAENDVQPVDRPEIDLVTLEEGQPCVFKATVAVKPEIVLGDYKGLEIEVKATEITDADVEKQVDSLREKGSSMVVVEDAVLAHGDFAIIDFDGFIDGKPFSGGQSKGYPLEVGSGSFIPGFEDQLIGAKTGEEREVTVTFPAEYFVPELAGKEAKFTVKINDIKRKELPALDDEFAKEVGGDVETLAELKEKIRKDLTEAAAKRDEAAFKEGAVKKAVDNVTVDIPAVMVEDEVDQMLHEMEHSLTSRGLNLEKYLQYTRSSIDDMKNHYRPRAAEQVKTQLVLDAIIKAEEMVVSDEEYMAELESIAQGYNMPVEQVKKTFEQRGRAAIVREGILRRKATDLIVESAVKA